MLEMQNVTKTFGDFTALKNLSLTVPKGAVYGLVGPNGAGKSTAIRHLTGIYRPDSGTVTMDGQPIYENPEIKAAIGFIPDDIFYYPSATLEDMRKFYKGIYPQFDDALFDKLLFWCSSLPCCRGRKRRKLSGSPGRISPSWTAPPPWCLWGRALPVCCWANPGRMLQT